MSKNICIVCLVIFLLNISSVGAQDSFAKTDGLSGKWKCDISISELGPFTTFLYFSSDGKQSFRAHSHKNADVRMLGLIKTIGGRIIGQSPKKGILIQIDNGRILSKKTDDSLYADILMPMVGKYKLTAKKFNDSIVGKLQNSTKTVGLIKGKKVSPEYTIDYDKVTNNILDTTQKYIFNPQILNTNHWQKFKRRLKRLSERAKDDVEYFLGFNMLSQKLPFSHYRLFIREDKFNIHKDQNTNTVFLDEINQSTVQMRIKSFSGSAEEMDSVFRKVLSNQYKNLIVDLRDNSGGGINSALVFGGYLVDEKTDVGVFLTNDWFNKYNVLPNSHIYPELPVSEAKTTEDFINELNNNKAVRLTVEPSANTFQGNVFLLTNNETASTCEPIVYSLKKNNIATVVGQRTAGAMLSATGKKIIGKYHLFIPFADFYTADGQRLEQKGVQPHISVQSSKALNYTINELLNE